jgi:hypothetical protein
VICPRCGGEVRHFSETFTFTPKEVTEAADGKLCFPCQCDLIVEGEARAFIHPDDWPLTEMKTLTREMEEAE